MAKISAYGDVPKERVRKNGVEYLLTRKHRLLRRFRYADGSWSGWTKVSIPKVRGEGDASVLEAWTLLTKGGEPIPVRPA